MRDLLIVVLPPAISGSLTVVAALVQGGGDWTRLTSVLGITFTVVLGVVMLAWFGVRESHRARTWRDRQTHTLDQFPQSQAGINADQKALDLDAEAVLSGAGPKVWPLSNGTLISVGQIFYVDEWKWVDPVFPNGDREEPFAKCGIEARGTLTVRGFSTERKSALVEYAAPGETAGTPCETGTFFFYRLPNLP